jgi:hypothetical protein
VDQKSIDAFRDSYSKSLRAAKILIVVAGIFAILAGYSFYGGSMLSGVGQSFGALGMLVAALKSRSAAKHIEPFIGITAEG